MKFIPKYQSPGMRLPGDWENYIIWNKNDWYARDKEGKYLFRNTGKDDKVTPYPYAFGSSISQRKRNQHGFINQNFNYEDQDWYTNFVSSLLTDGKINSHGKDYIQQYNTNTDDTVPWKQNLNNYINTGIWKPFEIDGVMMDTPETFINARALDKHPGQGHNTNSGYTYYITGENGETKFFNSIPKGYRRINKFDIEYDNLESEVNQLKSQSRFGNLVDFQKLVKDETNPYIEDKLDTPKLPNRSELFPNLSSEKDTSSYYLVDENGNPIYDDNGRLQKNPDYDPTSNVTPWKSGNVKDQTGTQGKSNVFSLFDGVASGLFGKLNKVYKQTLDKYKTDKKDKKPINPAWLAGIRVALDNAQNLRNVKELNKNSDINLSIFTPNYRAVSRDYEAEEQGKAEAGRLRTSQPITANAQIQSATDLEGIEKGNKYIENGYNKSAQMYQSTVEKAFLQGKENNRGWDLIANENGKAISDFNNIKQKRLYDIYKQNGQNVDTLLTDLEKRLQEKWDLREAKKLEGEEILNELYDKRFGLGSDLVDYENLQTQLQTELYKANPDQNTVVNLRNQINELNKKIIAQQYFNKLNRLGLYDQKQFSKMFPNFTPYIDSTSQYSNVPSQSKKRGFKYGGMIDFLASGGDFGIVAGSSLGGSNKFLKSLAGGESSGTTSKKNSSSKSSDSSQDEKQKDKLLTSIAETLKGVDGLESDVGTIYRRLATFFDLQRYSLSDDPMQFYPKYVEALYYINRAKQGAKYFDEAYKVLNEKKAMISPAIDPNGMVYVGIAGTDKIDRITPQQYLEDPKKYHLLRNNELLSLRRTHPAQAFSDELITEIAHTGTSIQDIHKFIKDLLGEIGNSKYSQDMLVRQYGSNAVQGIETLKKLIEGQLTTSETAELIAGLQGALTEMNVTKQDSVEQAKHAIAVIESMLPANMKTMLLLHAGSEDNVKKLIASFVIRGLDTVTEFKINNITALDENGLPKSGSTKNGKGEGSNSEDAEDRTLLDIVQGTGGTYDTITINPGTKSQLTVGAVNYTREGAYDPSNLSQALADSKIMAIADPRKIYFGDQKVNPGNIKDIYYSGNGFSRVLLPINDDGSPNFKLFAQFEKACDQVRKAGKDPLDFNDEEGQKMLAQKLEGTGLYNLVRGSLPDLDKIGLFLVTEGQTSSKAGVKNSNFVKIKDNPDYGELRRVLGGKGPDGKYMEYELDEPDWYNPSEWFGSGYDIIYEGTVYIPINNNPLQASTGAGNRRKQSAAMEQEKAYQASQNLRKYNSDNELKQ